MRLTYGFVGAIVPVARGTVGGGLLLVGLWGVDVMVRSSAYERMCVSCAGLGCGRSWRKRLKSVGDSTAPWGTPFGSVRVLDV